ncbi:MAG: CDP-diacylglycerol O-phosphatidyltransferase, partial [Odoribacter sp.]|nr:CDP-diacylglycerol O-phosphatidyltransferase [Odoribacter sp.]
VYTPELYGRLFANVYALGISTLILSVLLISELPMFSLKISGFGWRGNKSRYLYFISLIVLAVLFKATMLVFVVPLYVFFAVVSALVKFTTPNR